MSRLEEIKEHTAWTVDNGLQPRIDDSDLAWLINRVEELEYASKYNGELNEFLQKRKLPPRTLGQHVVDVVMDYVEELEKLNASLSEESRANFDSAHQYKKEINRYKQVLEEIKELTRYDDGSEEEVYNIAIKVLEGTE